MKSIFQKLFFGEKAVQALVQLLTKTCVDISILNLIDMFEN